MSQMTLGEGRVAANRLLKNNKPAAPGFPGGDLRSLCSPENPWVDLCPGGQMAPFNPHAGCFSTPCEWMRPESSGASGPSELGIAPTLAMVPRARQIRRIVEQVGRMLTNRSTIPC